MGERRVVMLRAVNVGGATLPMAGLRELATGLGAREVATYIASGNLICVPPADPEAFDRALESAVQARFGFFREAISRTGAELREALAAHPFEGDPASWSHVVFLLTEPTADATAAAAEVHTGAERWQVVGREVHIRYDHGAGRADPRLARALRRIGVPGTSRNLNTVRRLAELAED